MILRLLIFIVLFAAPVVAAGLGIRAKRKTKRLAAAARAQGLLNAELTCTECLGAINQGPGTETMYDVGTKRFYHRRCYQKLLT